MTALREAAHRWAVVLFVVMNLSLSAWRHVRRATHRRKMWRRVEAWPW